MDRKLRRSLTGTLLTAGVISVTALVAQEPPQVPPPGGFAGQRGPGQRGPGQGGPGQPPQAFRGGGGPGQAPFGPGPGVPGPPPFGMHPMPELGKKTSTVMALRMIVQSGLTAKEIQAVLPTLRDLREAEKTFKKRAEQLLDEEKNALLAARPGGPMPPDTGEKLHDAAQEFGEKSERTWQAVTREIGGEKAHMLRQLVQGVMGPGMGGGPAPGGFDGPGFGPDPFGGRPGPGQPGRPGGQGRPGRGGGPGGPPPSQTPQPGQPNAFDPFVPDSDPLVQVGLQAPGAPGPGLPAIPGTGDTPVPGVSGPGDANVTQAPPGARNAPRGGYGQQGRPGDQLANPQNRFNRPRGQGNPGPFTPQPDGGGFPMMGGGPRISVGELVELLEQRLAAMPK